MPPTKKRRLGDLYVVGKEVLVNDESGDEPVKVWLQKLNPVENDAALRAAGAARARYLAHKKEKDSDEYRAALSDVLDFASRNTLIDMVARDELATRRLRAEAEIGAEEEWSKDDYLQGIYDAWQGGPDHPALREVYEKDPENEEAKRIYDELQRFNAQVDKVMEGEREQVRRDYENRSDEELQEAAVERVLDNRGMTLFMREYETQMLLAAVREPENHKERYFESREEVEGLATEVRRMLLDHLQMITVERDEGKDLREIPASSPSSEPSATAETARSSGLVTVSR